jgi:16S rRNA processing protein RimM
VRPVAIGTIGRIHGLRGETVVRGEPGLLELIESAERLFLEEADGLRPVTARGVRPLRDGVGVRFDGVDDRSAAEALRGTAVLVDADALPPPTPERYVFAQIVGYEVETDGGERLGHLEERIQTGANDVFVVRSAEREYLIPAIDEVLLRFDGVARRLVIHPLPGLLEINEP